MFESFKASLRGPEPEPKPRIRGNDELDRQEREARLKKDLEEAHEQDKIRNEKEEIKRQEKYKQEGRNEDGTLKPETEKRLAFQLKQIEEQEKELERQTEYWKAEWKKYEEKNYMIKSNFQAGSPEGAGRAIDSIKLEQGDRYEQEKKRAHDDAFRANESFMNQAQAKIDEIGRQKLDLMIEKQKIENALAEVGS